MTQVAGPIKGLLALSSIWGPPRPIGDGYMSALTPETAITAV
ncbi:MAG: hypothetical protein NZ707_00505 [Rhodospirillales bacterium]|nr:hypothetical protein [Rhodospirillales bacterium]